MNSSVGNPAIACPPSTEQQQGKECLSVGLAAGHATAPRRGDGRWQMADGDGRRAEAEGGGRMADGRTERWRLPSPGSVFPARVPCRCWPVLEGSKDGMMGAWTSDSC